MTHRIVPLACATFLFHSGAMLAQTTAGTSATLVVPIVAQTASFISEVTVYNPTAGPITIDPIFYDAQNTGSPGPKNCTSLVLGAGISAQFSLSSQCALPAGSNFGLLVLAETTGTHGFYGYARTQTPQGVGFSTEGFPIENFNDQLQHVTGLKRVAAAGGVPAFQTNCFVASLGAAVSYQLRLFNGTTNAQLGNTLGGTLQPFQQFRYLDVFAAASVPTGNRTNVRAQFTNVTGANKKLIGFCTVQENATLSADFRIAKSFGGTPQNAFVQGGNALGTTALLGTLDSRPLSVLIGGRPALRLAPVTDQNADSTVNVVNGASVNTAGPDAFGATIAGGGFATGSGGGPAAPNQVTANFGTVSGGAANSVTGNSGTVAGGEFNVASNFNASIGGGFQNVASGSGATVCGGDANTASGASSTVAGGSLNTAAGINSFAAGLRAKALAAGSIVFGDSTEADITSNVPNQFIVAASGGVIMVTNKDTSTGCFMVAGGGDWLCTSSRDVKRDFADVDVHATLRRVMTLPLSTWRFRNEDPHIRHLGPMAQDFRAAFGLGENDVTISHADEAGVALAAIQALDQLVREKDDRIRALEEQLHAQQDALDNVRLAVEALLHRDAR